MKVTLSIRWTILLTFLLAYFLATPVVHAFGGVNNIFHRMEQMVTELHQAGAFTDADQDEWEEIIKSLREKAAERIKKEDSLSTLRDKDLYDEIDSWNQSLFNQYQQFKKDKEVKDTPEKEGSSTP